MPNFRFGTLVLRIDGVQHFIEGDWELNPGVGEGTAVTGPDGQTAIQVTPNAAMVSGNARDHGDLDVAELLALRGVTVTCELANGKAWVLRNCDQIGSGAMNMREGTVPLVLVSQNGPAQEI